MAKIIPGEIATRDLHQFLVASIAPRPIAFVSTKDKDGHANLAPYSFFNVFSSNPPILVFSSNRRVLDNTTKDTLHNVQTTGECVINVVTHSIVRQMAVSSVQFDTGVNEFKKSGLTPLESDMVSPFRVKESPVNLECKVRDIITLGDQGGAGHLVICDVLCMHIDDSIIDDNNRIDPHKIDLMGRLGRAYYSRTSGEAVHTIVQPVTTLVIGYDSLPESAKKSTVLNGNDVGMLAGCFAHPTEEEMTLLKNHDNIQSLVDQNNREELEKLAKTYLAQDQSQKALGIMHLLDQM